MRVRDIALAVLVTSLALIGGISANAQVANITFEGQSNEIYSAPILRQGYDIGNPAGQEQHFHEIDSTQFSLPSNGTGVLLNDRDTEIFVAAHAGFGFTQFSLGTVDVAAALGNGPANGLVLTGFLNNVSTGTITIPVLSLGYSTVNGSALGIVDTLVFDGIGGDGGFVLDNLNLTAPGNSAVPEPGSLTILAGLCVSGGVFAIRRLRRK